MSRPRPIEISYTLPTMGPKAYTARGPSGWTETFARKAADARLQHLLGEVPVAVAVEGFRNRCALAHTPAEWYSVQTYLGELAHIDAKLVPDEAIVALWCQVLADTGPIRN